MELTNQSAIITGGASGMGAATAHALTQAGVKVAIFDTNQQAAEQLAQEIKGIACVCDVRDEQSIIQALKQTTAAQGPARICINCAGIAPAERIVGREGPMSLDMFKQCIDINLIGTFNMMRLAAAHMAELSPLTDDERGVIINTASIAAYEGQVGQAAYSASKGGIVSMTLPAAREFARFGIRVVTIAPGLIATPMMQGMSDKVQEALLASTVFPKRLGHADEFSQLVLQVLKNTLLNGCVIRLDGAVRLAG